MITFHEAARLYGFEFSSLQVAGANVRRSANWHAMGCKGTAEEYEACFIRAVESEHNQEPMP